MAGVVRLVYAYKIVIYDRCWPASANSIENEYLIAAHFRTALLRPGGVTANKKNNCPRGNMQQGGFFLFFFLNNIRINLPVQPVRQLR